jgi:hypothetical protein
MTFKHAVELLDLLMNFGVGYAMQLCGCIPIEGGLVKGVGKDKTI